MKKNVRRLALFLAMVMAFTVTAFAATQSQYDNIVSTGTAVDEDKLEGTVFGSVTLAAGSATIEITFYGESAPEKATITYRDASKITLNSMYLVTLLSKNANGEYVPGDGNIQYIDQVTCTTAGEITFDVYPSAVTDGIIAIYGASGELLVAVVEGSLLLGDVNDDGEVNTKDLTRLARHLVGADVDINAKNADVNVDSELGTKDLTRLARFLVGGATLG